MRDDLGAIIGRVRADAAKAARKTAHTARPAAPSPATSVVGATGSVVLTGGTGPQFATWDTLPDGWEAHGNGLYLPWQAVVVHARVVYECPGDASLATIDDLVNINTGLDIVGDRFVGELHVLQGAQSGDTVVSGAQPFGCGGYRDATGSMTVNFTVTFRVLGPVQDHVIDDLATSLLGSWRT